jgi:hypothetical protein
MAKEWLLLTVQDSFILVGRGIALVPALPADLIPHSKQGAMFQATLERPDGTTEQANIRIYLKHFNPGGHKLICYLQETEIGKVPIGTRVWVIESL